jgi:multidrug efflux pump
MFFYVLETMSEKSASKKAPGSSGGPTGGGTPPVAQPGPGTPTIKPSAPREDD